MDLAEIYATLLDEGGLALLTPAPVHYGHVDLVIDHRQSVLDAA
ncbi:hypothetical protein [Iamia sp.]|nr:hypothetical protein [Iamia sp.]HXH58495.1 hypothetical protein [Iamia sp.]